MTTPTFVYKILTKSEWPINPNDTFPTALDARDGFIHLSQARQANKVANLYFPDHASLMLLRIPVSKLQSKDLRWEDPVHPTTTTVVHTITPGSGDELFPHLYGSRLEVDGVVDKVEEIVRTADGRFALEHLEW